MVAESDRIIALSPSHLWHLGQWLSDAVAELINDSGVLDPIGGSRENYEECAAEIEAALREHWLERVCPR